MIVPGLLFATVLCQSPSGKPVRPKLAIKVVDEATPVTASEARASLIRTAALLGRSTGVAFGSVSIPSASRPVRRDEVIAELVRWYAKAEPNFKMTLAPVAYDARLVRVAPDLKVPLSRLLARGAIAPTGPLVVGPTATLTPKQLGDALGYFVARLSQLSHLPSPRWSPALMDPGG